MMGRTLLGALMLVAHGAVQGFLFERTQVDEVFEFDGDSHWQFGYELGQRFADKIQTRLRLNAAVQTLVLPYLETMEGQELYGTYLQSHNTTFPVRVKVSLLLLYDGCLLNPLHARLCRISWRSWTGSLMEAASPSR